MHCCHLLTAATLLLTLGKSDPLPREYLGNLRRSPIDTQIRIFVPLRELRFAGNHPVTAQDRTQDLCPVFELVLPIAVLLFYLALLARLLYCQYRLVEAILT